MTCQKFLMGSRTGESGIDSTKKHSYIKWKCTNWCKRGDELKILIISNWFVALRSPRVPDSIVILQWMLSFSWHLVTIKIHLLKWGSICNISSVSGNSNLALDSYTGGFKCVRSMSLLQNKKKRKKSFRLVDMYTFCGLMKKQKILVIFVIHT